MARTIYWVKEKKENAIKIVFSKIEAGKSLRGILNGSRDKALLPSRRVFNEWLSGDSELSNHYARACEERAELIFDEILSIADSIENDVTINEEGVQVINHNIIQRDRLRVEARKWALSKMNPKKYGEKQSIEMETIEEKPFIFEIIDGRKT